jgi:hypothetical protein
VRDPAQAHLKLIDETARALHPSVARFAPKPGRSERNLAVDLTMGRVEFALEPEAFRVRVTGADGQVLLSRRVWSGGKKDLRRRLKDTENAARDIATVLVFGLRAGGVIP